MSEWTSFIPLLLIVVIFWLFIVRPARKRQQQFLDLQSELEAGLDVITTSGIYGQIVSLDERVVRLRIADAIEIRIDRQAIGEIVRPETPTVD